MADIKNIENNNETEVIEEAKKKPEPIVINDEKYGKVYTLDFTRATSAAINKAGFNYNDIDTNPEEMIPLLWFGAFRKNHRAMSREETDKMLERIGGLSEAIIKRLFELYLQGREALFAEDEEFENNAKNAGLTVSL